MNTKLLLPLLILVGCSGAKHETNQPLKIVQANWLVGSWNSESKHGSTYETWRQLNDSIYVGISYTLANGDTVSSERMKLVQQGDEINYVPIVKGQNSGMPVAFRLTFIDSRKLVFENPGHDFPQKIGYTKTSKDSLVAEISGMLKGAYHVQKFPMRRVK